MNAIEVAHRTQEVLNDIGIASDWEDYEHEVHLIIPNICEIRIVEIAWSSNKPYIMLRAVYFSRLICNISLSSKSDIDVAVNIALERIYSKYKPMMKPIVDFCNAVENLIPTPKP